MTDQQEKEEEQHDFFLLEDSFTSVIRARAQPPCCLSNTINYVTV